MRAVGNLCYWAGFLVLIMAVIGFFFMDMGVLELLGVTIGVLFILLGIIFRKMYPNENQMTARKWWDIEMERRQQERDYGKRD